MYAIKAGTKDEDWADAFRHCLDLIDEDPALSVPADKQFITLQKHQPLGTLSNNNRLVFV